MGLIRGFRRSKTIVDLPNEKHRYCDWCDGFFAERQMQIVAGDSWVCSNDCAKAMIEYLGIF